MDIQKTIDSNVDNIFITLKPSFCGIYVEEFPISSRALNKNKEDTLKELVALLVRKFLKSEDAIDGFNSEFLFAEGKDYSIYVAKIADNISIATILEQKGNFSLLKLEHDKVIKNLAPFEQDIKQLAEQIIKQQEEKQQEAKTQKEEPQEKAESKKEPGEEQETVKEKTETIVEQKQEEEQISDDIANLEEAFSIDEQIEEKEADTKEDIIDEKIEQITEEEIQEAKEETTPIEIEEEEAPSLEDLLLDEEQLETVDPEVLEKIQTEFIKEIGPFGKMLFNKKVKELNIDASAPSKIKVQQLIDVLAQEIIVEDRKQKFIDFTNELL